MKLYEITSHTRELQSMADSGELTAEDIKDTLDGLDAQFDEKVEAALKVRQSMLSEVVAIEREIDRLVELKKTPENSAARLSVYIKDNMLSLGKDKVDAGLFKVTLRKATVKLGELDELKIHDSYFQIIPEARKLDRRLLLKDAKLNAIDGVELTESERSLTIK